MKNIHIDYKLNWNCTCHIDILVNIIYRAFHLNCTSLRVHISERTRPILMKFDNKIEQSLTNYSTEFCFHSALYRTEKLILPKPPKIRSYHFYKIFKVHHSLDYTLIHLSWKFHYFITFPYWDITCQSLAV